MPPESVFADGILTVYRLGVMTLVSIDPGPDAPSGAAVRGFAPERSMSRGDVAAPLVRLWQVLDRDCPTTASAPFNDIDDPQLAADADCLRGVGVTNGTTATTYSPELLVTRAQTASLLIRVWRLLGRECPDDDAPPFDDVAPGNVHHDDVLCLRGLGITRGTTATTFTPEAHVTRAQFATMLTRLRNQLIAPPPDPDPEPDPESDPDPDPDPDPESDPAPESDPDPDPDPESDPEPRPTRSPIPSRRPSPRLIPRRPGPGHPIPIPTRRPSLRRRPSPSPIPRRRPNRSLIPRRPGPGHPSPIPTRRPSLRRSPIPSPIPRRRPNRSLIPRRPGPGHPIPIPRPSLRRRPSPSPIPRRRRSPEPDPEAAGTGSPDPDPGPESQPEAQAQPDPDPDPEAQPESDPSAQAQPESDPGPEAQPEAQAQPESDPEAAGTGSPEPEVEPEPEVLAPVELPAPSRPRRSAGGLRAPLPADVSAQSVYAEGVLAVVRRAIMPVVSVQPDPGAPAVTHFVPEQTMSRADVAAPLVRLWQVLGQACPETTADRFDDIDDLQVAADVGCLRSLGVATGTTATTYSPEQPVTRAQASTLLARVWRLLGRDCPDDDAPPFDDVPAGSVHHDSVLCLRSLGITSGTTATTFSPDLHVTRAQFATLVARLYNLAT